MTTSVVPPDGGAASEGSGLPEGGDVGDVLVNVAPGEGDWSPPEAGSSTDNIRVTLDGGGIVLPAGTAVDIPVDFDCTIQGVTMIADLSGSCVVDIYKAAYSTTYNTTVADTITASAKPTLSSARGSRDTTLTGWTTTITAGDVLRFIVNSATTVTRVAVALKVLKS